MIELFPRRQILTGLVSDYCRQTHGTDLEGRVGGKSGCAIFTCSWLVEGGKRSREESRLPIQLAMPAIVVLATD